jgi:hypothetical protein
MFVMGELGTIALNATKDTFYMEKPALRTVLEGNMVIM